MSEPRAGAALFPPVASAGRPLATPVDAFARGRAQGRQEGALLAQAQAREQGHQQGFAIGHAQGLQEGLAQGRAQALAELQAQAQTQACAELQAQARHLAQLAQGLIAALAQAEDALAQDLLDLALVLARQVLARELALDPTLMLPLVRGLLQAEPALVGQPQLLLHPEDLDLVREHLAEELQAAGWQLRADAGMARGGCLVRAATGEIDARLDTRWQRVAAALAGQAPAIVEAS